MMQHNFCSLCPNLQINCTMRKTLCLWQRHRLSIALFMLLQTFSFLTFAQVEISGKVTGPAGEPMSAVTVQILGTTAATATANDGTFKLSANLKDGNYRVSFTGVGVKTVERSIAVGATKTFTIDVPMENDVLGLNEVIV